MSQRAHNFFAGPAVLPYSVLEETRDAVMDFAGLGVSIMEVSHRDKTFDKVKLILSPSPVFRRTNMRSFSSAAEQACNSRWSR
jgi:hypothetical protein